MSFDQFIAYLNIKNIRIITAKRRDQLLAIEHELSTKLTECEKNNLQFIELLKLKEAENSELKKEYDQLKAGLDEKNSYDLVLLSDKKGFYAYKYNRGDKIEHYLCTFCFNSTGIKQILNIQREDSHCFCYCSSCGKAKGIRLSEGWCSQAAR